MFIWVVTGLLVMGVAGEVGTNVLTSSEQSPPASSDFIIVICVIIPIIFVMCSTITICCLSIAEFLSFRAGMLGNSWALQCLAHSAPPPPWTMHRHGYCLSVFVLFVSVFCRAKGWAGRQGVFAYVHTTTPTYVHVHSFIHSLIHSFIHSFIHSCIHTYTNSY